MEKGKRIKFRNWDCELVQQQYQNGRLALQLVAWDNDSDKDVVKGELIASCTVNMPDVPLEPNEVLIKNYSENQGMLAALLIAGVVRKTEKSVQSGWAKISICEIL